MTQEEINKLKALRDDWKSTGNRAWKEIEENFPEVFESKDEKIRKAILNHIRMYSKINGVKSFDNVSTEDIIGYLERKKEPTDEEMIRTLRCEYEKGVADTIAKYEQKTAVPTNLSDDERIREMLIKYFKELKVDSFINLEIPDILAYLERQKEQKPADKVEPIVDGLETEFQKQVSHLIASAMNREHEYNLGFIQWVAQSLLGYAQHEQKPAEWSYPYGKNETVDQLIAIAECLEMDGDCSFNGYKGEDCGKFLRELARRESENKPADYDHEMWKNCEVNFEGGKKEVIDNPEKYGLCEKVEWSKEDEECRKELIQYIEQRIGDGTTGQSLWNKWHRWLKDIPNRISLRPQSKDEWNDEDEWKLNEIIKYLEDKGDYRSCWVSFLKDLPNRFSLRPHWKPTEEQYYALRDAIIKLDADDSDARFPWPELPILHSLRNDLEKLRK